MSKLKVTGGEWKQRQQKNGDILISGRINDLYHEIGRINFRKENDSEDLLVYREACLANANLIADAGTTHNKCGLTPSELLDHLHRYERKHEAISKENDELLQQNEELKKTIAFNIGNLEFLEGSLEYSLERANVVTMIINLKEVLTKYKSNP